MSRTNETRYIKWHKTCKRQCRLDASVCNNKQRWNNDKGRCECRELTDKGVWDKRFIWNPSNCECECDNSCYVGEYLDYGNCKCRKRLVDNLVEECGENVEELKLAGITSTELQLAENKNVCKSSCTLYIVLFKMIFTINIRFATYFIYDKYMNRNKENVSRYDYVYQATNC